MTASAMLGDREKCLDAGMDDYIAKPVRLEDLRAIIERWGTIAAVWEPVETTPPESAPEGSAESDPEAPVDMARLNEFTEGDADSFKELATLYLTQTSEQLEALEAAVAEGAAPEVRRLAHSCAGASATCGMRFLVPLLRQMERESAEGNLANAQTLCSQAVQEFSRIRLFLQACMAPHLAPTAPTQA